MRSMRLLAIGVALAALCAPALAQERPLRDAVARDYRDNSPACSYSTATRSCGREVRRPSHCAELRALGYELTDRARGTGVVACCADGAGRR